jgi:radical SAM superfamily enzyme YgiQ (UPF0313 family)
VHVLLISTYDLGRQPFGLASPAAWLQEAGLDVVCADLAKERLQDAAVAQASMVAFFLPMHTATRLAVPVIDRVRAINPAATLAAYGLYAPLNVELLRGHGVTHVLGGEFEADLVAVARTVVGGGPWPGVSRADAPIEAAKSAAIPRLSFLVPVRDGLPPLDQYATLLIAGERRTAGYTEASRGCKHRCRHCPIVPVYDGRFRTVAVDVVLGDVRAQVAAGARHITFGDPDFFNGIRHAEAVITGMAREFPGVTYDVTIKIEHLLKHAGHLPRLRDTGCVFVTSAVESIDDHVLAKLEKGHTRADFERVVMLCQAAGLPLSATFVPFSPWTTIDSYLDLLHVIDALDLVENVAPVQFVVRLLIPQGSRMLELPDVRAVTAGFDATSLTYPWVHADPSVDALQQALNGVVSGRLMSPRRELFGRIWEAAHEHAGVAAPRRHEGALRKAAIPSLDEPWFCCAEPTAEQLARI